MSLFTEFWQAFTQSWERIDCCNKQAIVEISSHHMGHRLPSQFFMGTQRKQKVQEGGPGTQSGPKGLNESRQDAFSKH